MNKDTILLINGKKVDIPTFMVNYGVDNQDRAIELAELLVKKGRATVYTPSSKEDDLIKKLERDEQFENIVKGIEEEEHAYERAKRDSKAEDVDLTNIRLHFRNTPEACNAEYWINGLGIEDTAITIKHGKVSLEVRNITPQEYTKIARRYQADKAIGTTVDFANKTLTSTTDAINYGLTHVVAPTAKIAGEVGMSIGKGVLHTGMKVGAGLINSGSKAITETKVAMATDVEMIKAKKELVDAKDSALSFFRRKMGSAKRRSGIEEF